MEEKMNTIKDLDVEEREEIIVDMARALESAARDAFAEGHRHFAIVSTNMAEAIRINANELARDDPRNAERVLEQAAAMIAQFKAVNPYPLVSMALH